MLGMTPGEDVGGEERERELVPPPLRKLYFSLDLCIFFSAVKQSKNSEK